VSSRFRSQPTILLPNAMSRMDDWFDERKIRPVLLRKIAYEAGIDGFEVMFSTETEAQLFDEAFG
jgi:hypothetical protein